MEHAEGLKKHARLQEGLLFRGTRHWGLELEKLTLTCDVTFSVVELCQLLCCQGLMQAVGYWDMSLLQLILLKFDWTTSWLTWHMWLALFARLGTAISSQKPLRHTTVESQACKECRRTMPNPCPNKRRFWVSAKFSNQVHCGILTRSSTLAFSSKGASLSLGIETLRKSTHKMHLHCNKNGVYPNV